MDKVFEALENLKIAPSLWVGLQNIGFQQIVSVHY